MNAIFKKSILISVLGHLTLFGIFGFTFGRIIPSANYANIYFLGRFLRSADLTYKPHQNPEALIFKRSNMAMLNKINRDHPQILACYLKPTVSLMFNIDKDNYAPKPITVIDYVRKKESVIMFHPSLPYHFLLYFKDRQVAHIELMFNIIPQGKTNSIIVKRKISSGNLEVDLLSMRYISHYLFIQQRRFPLNNWQTVKIEFNPKGD